MHTQQVGEAHADGLHALQAEFYTEHLMIQGEIVSVDLRISDHLNSSADTIHIRPIYAERHDGSRIHVNVAHASITKAHLLFILPMLEPDPTPRADNPAWAFTMTRPVWAALGRYQVNGKVHTEAGRAARQVLRAFEQKQFFPITDGVVSMPDGSERGYPTVIVNRSHLEILAI